VSGGVGEDLERERVEAVAGKHRLGFPERPVDGRLAAPEVVIVHARQIVVDQAVDMDRLDRAADPQRPLGIDREQLSGSGGKQRAQALAAADRCVAHRGIQPFAPVVGGLQKAAEETVDLGGDARRLLVELDASPVDRFKRHRTA
jgi:hypothetical protein